MRRRSTIALVTIALLTAACSSTDDGGGPVTTEPAPAETTTTSGPQPITILVTNDDGIGAPGIDAVVNALVAMELVSVVVVAPAENKSGSSDTTTPAGVEHAAAATASGVEGTAVKGFPADTIAVALDELGLEPDLVVSGINEGQNVGPIAFVSGTVGAARTAARRGIPALAASAGLGADADYATAAELVVAWVDQHRAEIAAGTLTTSTVASINVPACTLGGEVEALVEVPLAAAIPEGVDPFNSDCSFEPPEPPGDDVAALVAGHPALTVVPLDAP
ncbi:MAG: 5'/3'-nucleotidase SurE [Actinomycetota bacterium]